MSHILSYPSVGTPTYTVTLHPALVTIQDYHSVEPYQRMLEASDGTQYTFQLSTNLRVVHTVEFVDLHEGDWGSFSGLNSLYAFFATRTTWGLSPFDLTHDDGATTTVRLLAPYWQFTETLRQRHTGTMTFLKVI
jgi:hypothetical protein